MYGWFIHNSPLAIHHLQLSAVLHPAVWAAKKVICQRMGFGYILL